MRIKCIQEILTFSIKCILVRSSRNHSFSLREGEVRSSVLQTMSSNFNDIVSRVSDGLRPIGVPITPVCRST